LKHVDEAERQFSQRGARYVFKSAFHTYESNFFGQVSLVDQRLVVL
jgi:hypothetical protein